MTSVAIAFAMGMAGCSAAPYSLWLGIAFKSALMLAFPVLVWKLRILALSEIGTLLSAGIKTTPAITQRLGWMFGQ